MDNVISYPGLMFALLLSWASGIAVVYFLLSQTRNRNGFILVGQGYFVGTFLTTLAIRGWDSLGLSLSFWPIAFSLIAIAGLFGGLALRMREPATRLPTTLTPHWQKLVIALLLGLIAWRYGLVLSEIATRPLYAWDAWMNWVPKAITWYHNSQLVSFVPPEQWLQQGPTGSLHTLGNFEASEYPPTVPLIQLWSMLGAGTDDHTLLFMPWLLLPINLAVALYGHLKLAGVSSLIGVTACYVFLSLPYVNVHTALPGYADLWLGAVFGVAIFALYQWQMQRHWGYGVLFLVHAVMCSQLKLPGMVLCLILLIVFLRELLRPPLSLELALVAFGSIVLGIGFLFGFSIPLAGLGELAIDERGITVPMLGTYALDLYPVGPAFINSIFMLTSWHLLWFFASGALVLALLHHGISTRIPAHLLALVLSIAFVILVFSVTKHYKNALDYTTINRAILYVVPAVIFCLTSMLRPTTASESISGERN